MTAGLYQFALEAANDPDAGLWWSGSGRGGVGAYEAAKPKRLDGDFQPRASGPNLLAETWGGLDLVTRKVRDLCDNHPIIDGAVDRLVRNVIGTGIDEIEPDTGWKDVDDQLAEIQAGAFGAVDPERKMTLAASQQLFFRELFMGEVIVHWPVAKPWRERPAGVAIELIEMERCERTLTGQLPGGGFVRQGVEFDADRRVVAYHVYSENPVDGWIGRGFTSLLAGGKNGNGRRLSIEDADLVTIPRRIGEIRGVPLAVSGINTAWLESKFVDDTMALAALISRLGVFFTGGAVPESFFKAKNGKPVICIDAMGNPVLNIGQGNVSFLPPGMEIKLAGTQVPGPGFEPGKRGLDRRLAVATRNGYAGVSGDYSQTTFASQRAERLDEDKAVKKMQEHAFNTHTQPYRRRLFRAALLTGELRLTREQLAAVQRNPDILLRASVGFPGSEYVNPAQESMAAGEDIANGVRSRIEVIQARGGNWKRVARDEVKYEVFKREERVKAGLPPDAPEPRRSGVSVGDRARGADELRKDDETGDNGETRKDGGDDE